MQLRSYLYSLESYVANDFGIPRIHITELLLFNVRQNCHLPCSPTATEAPHRQRFACVVIVLHRNAELLEIVDALRAAGRFARSLNRRQQQCDQECR